MQIVKTNNWYIDFIPRLGSFWLGVHYSNTYKSYCIALIPCLILRVGRTPYKPDLDIFQKGDCINGYKNQICNR